MIHNRANADSLRIKQMTRWMRFSQQHATVLMTGQGQPITAPSSDTLHFCVNKSKLSRLLCPRRAYHPITRHYPRRLKLKVIVRLRPAQLEEAEAEEEEDDDDDQVLW